MEIVNFFISSPRKILTDVHPFVEIRNSWYPSTEFGSFFTKPECFSSWNNAKIIQNLSSNLENVYCTEYLHELGIQYHHTQMKFSIELISVVIIHCISKQIHSWPGVVDLKYSQMCAHQIQSFQFCFEPELSYRQWMMPREQWLFHCTQLKFFLRHSPADEYLK